MKENPMSYESGNGGKKKQVKREYINIIMKKGNPMKYDKKTRTKGDARHTGNKYVNKKKR